MSDPMTNTEVEDVLASIRRLVSDDNRPETNEKSPTPSDRLVLTPALRVMDDAAPQESDAPDDHDVEDADWHEDADVYSASDAPEFEPDSAEHAEDELHSDAAADEHLDADAPQSEDAATGEGAAPITLDTVDLDRDTLVSIQEAFADIDQAEAAEVEPEPEAADPEPEAEPSELVAEASDPEPEGEAEPDSAVDAGTLSAKIAALETLIAGQSDEFEPEMAGDGENAGTEPPTLEWEDAAEDADTAASEPAATEPEAPIEAAAEEAQIFSSDEDVLDEEALRDLVSHIVREELQGALGERITRNVRKLVRREIHRALAAQDLE